MQFKQKCKPGNIKPSQTHSRLVFFFSSASSSSSFFFLHFRFPVIASFASPARLGALWMLTTQGQQPVKMRDTQTERESSASKKIYKNHYKL